MRIGEFSSVGQVLTGLQETTPWGQRLARQKVLRYWEEVVGETVARVSRPVEVRGRTLYVHVRDSVWLQQLSLMREDLRARLNGASGEEGIDGIFFSLGPLFAPPNRASQGSGGSQEEARRVAAERLVAEDLDVKALDRRLEVLQDLETRRQVRQALLRGELDRRIKELR